MQEDFLHYIWKYKTFHSSHLKTVGGETVTIKQFGQHNHNAGPDFFNAQLYVDDQLWAGNIEIHLKSSDWYLHKHEKDPAYDNVILHVVWENDIDIFRKDNSIIPTLVLKPYVDIALLKNYKELLYSKSWINCEADFSEVDNFTINNWLERLYIYRLERKANEIADLLEHSNNDWEAVLFKLLLKNFGLKVNGEAFLSLANSVNYSIFRKLQCNAQELEALLFGQANLLNDDIQNSYYHQLQRHYKFIVQKFRINNEGVFPVQFFRLRPQNFPTIRLAQFAQLYSSEQQLFSKIAAANTKETLYEIFNTSVSDFWKTHYSFTAASKISNKKLTKPFIDLLIINTIIPVKFSYAHYRGTSNHEALLELLKEINLENNSIVKQFFRLKALDKNALTSQSLLQLKGEFCDKNKCLECAIGNRLILKN